jgi:hypothetical protein
MMHRRLIYSLVLAMVMSSAMAGTASADPEGTPAEVDKQGEGIAAGDQHGDEGGHLPGSSENVELVGRAPIEGAAPGRVADVAAYGSYAYLTVRDPENCAGDNAAGVAVFDASDPTNPTQVGFIDATSGSLPGEGAQVIDVQSAAFSGQLLVTNNENCNDEGLGGLSLVDVTDPLNPQPLAENFGDTTTFPISETQTATVTNEYHSAFAWTDGDSTYAVGVDNYEAIDIDIFDVTDPTAPTLIAEVGFPDFPQVRQDPPPLGDSNFHHDVVVKEIDGVQTMLASYWDSGWVILDVSDPANPVYLRDFDYADVEPFIDELGLPEGSEPEGNAHQAEFTPDNRFFIGTDEDFGPYRLLMSNEEDGTVSNATQGSDTPPVTPDAPFGGATVFVGRACPSADDPEVPAGNGEIAVVERGVCTFQEKADAVAAAGGYSGMIIMNREGADACAGILTPLVAADFPILFVGRDTGFALFDEDFDLDACLAGDGSATSDIPIGTTGDTVSFSATFDGWGYVHLVDANTMEDIDQYAIDESLDEDFAQGFGALSVHEVAVDPERDGLAYLSYYSGGLRVIEYGEDGIEEVGHFIDDEGNDFWGVEYWTSPETCQDYILASDRDSGLYIFQYGDMSQGVCPGEPESVTVRISGAGRIETAVEVSRASYETGTAGAVVLARADVFADALAGTPLAIDVDAPILLTDSDTLHPLVESELARVLPETGTPTVYLLGGTVALDQPVEDRLDELGYDTVRYGGLNRFDTATIIADEGLDNPDTLLLANGGDFPDAVSAGAAAGNVDGAVLLTSGADMAPETAAYIEAHPVETRTAIGGSAAQADPDATAIVGANRVATAVMVAESFFPSPAVVGLATAGDFADGLTGGAMVGRLGGPILLTDGAALSAEVRTYLEDNTDSITTAYIYGGVEALSQDVQDDVEDILTP